MIVMLVRVLINVVIISVSLCKKVSENTVHFMCIKFTVKYNQEHIIDLTENCTANFLQLLILPKILLFLYAVKIAFKNSTK